MASTSSMFGSIRNRLLFGTTALVAIPLILLALVLGYFAVTQSTASLNQRANDQLQSIREGKVEEVTAYFENVADSMRVIVQTGEVRSALRELPAAYAALPASLGVSEQQARDKLLQYYTNDFGTQYAKRNPGKTSTMKDVLGSLPIEAVAAQYLYIANNPNPLGEKFKLNRSEDGSSYSTQHPAIHSMGSRAVEEYGLYDFFLVDMNGNLVYTYFKELDFGTNLISGPWAKSGLGQAYAAARSGKKAGEVSISDYAPYLPSYDDQASFLSMPVFDGGQQIGVFLVQLPIDRVNQIMTFNANWKEVGLGESGEVYLVGQDKTPRSISRFMQENPDGFVQMMKGLNAPAAALASMGSRKTNIGVMNIDTLGVNEALAGRKGTGVYPDYRGIDVLGSYAPIDVLGMRWALISEIDESESAAPVTKLRNQILLIALGALVLMAAAGVFFAQRLARSINTPLEHFGAVVAKVARGDKEVRVKLPATDEIGQLGQAFDGMLDERNAVQAKIEKENEDLNNSVVEIMMSVAELAQKNLEVKVPVAENVTGAVSDAINMMTNSTAGALGKVRTISGAVSSASMSVRSRSEQVSQVAAQATDQATNAAQEIQETAMALRQMGEQATQANQHAEHAIKATGDALEIVRATVSGISSSRDQIRETEKRVKRLAERSQEIGTVVNIIGQIAERTSVLALNASMQAVSAGEAGRGFAVVADEVKRLAENARQATQQISTLVSAIQADTADTIQTMNGTIAQVVDISKLADQAGGQMNDTRQATEQLVAAVRSISTSTQAQSQASQKLLTRAYELMQSSQKTMDELDAQRVDTESLAQSATELVSTVQQFKLPATA